MARVLVFALCFAAGCNCTPGRTGRLLPDGALERPPDSGVRPRDGAVDMDADVGADGAVDPDGSVPRDGDTPLPDAGPPRFELDCDDGVDQDRDGRTDCEDEDCEGAPCDASGTLFCEERMCGGCTETSETSCGDGIDEDCDGMRDCADPECDGVVCGLGDVVCGGGTCPCPSGFEERMCGDGTDDDCDGLVDCDDPDCMGRACGAMGVICLPDGSCGCGGSVELCQGIDDDCSGEVDEGCPVGVGQCCSARAGSFGGPLGTSWLDACPTGAALIGVAGREGPQLEQLQPICAALVFEQDVTTSPEHTFRVRRGAPILGAQHGASGPTTFDDRCPGDEVAIGLGGAADEDFVDAISLQCARVTIGRNRGFDWRISVTPTGNTPTRGAGGGGSSSVSASCAAGSVIVAFDGRESTRVNFLGATCQRLQLSLR
ncbi:MAG: hypothetical protein VYE22_21520 [Myxococcota bacterium]|nr:hypothetical protein [Myxococcota bacterium]